MLVAYSASMMAITLLRPAWIIWIFMVVLFIVAVWQFFNPVAASRWRAGSLYGNSTSPAWLASMRIFALVFMILDILLAIAYLVGWVR